MVRRGEVSRGQCGEVRCGKVRVRRGLVGVRGVVGVRRGAGAAWQGCGVAGVRACMSNQSLPSFRLVLNHSRSFFASCSALSVVS